MKTKILLLVIISLSLLNSCSRYETCERLTWQRRHIVDNFNKLSAQEELILLQQTDSMIVKFCVDK